MSHTSIFRAFSQFNLQLAIAIPVLVAALGITWQTVDLISKLEYSTNESEHHRNSDLVRSAFNSLQAQISQVTVDNSYWDFAVENVASKNATWLYNNWGVTTGNENYIYDTSLIIDSKTGEPLAAFHNGEEIRTSTSDMFGNHFANVLAAMPAENGSPSVTSGFTQTPYGISVFAMSPIVAYSPEVQARNVNTAYLVFLKHISPAVIAELEKQYLIDGIAVSFGTTQADSHVRLDVPDGTPQPVVSWRDQKLGGSIARDLWRRASFSLGFLLAVLAGMAAACWHLLRRMIRSEAKAKHDAMTDSLTGLPNRLSFNANIGSLRSSGRSDFAVAFADLDGFKEVNDSFGHHCGDQLIQRVAGLLRELSPDATLHCRLGGDEFVVLFTGDKADQKAQIFSARLISGLARHFEFDGRIVSVGVSIGIAAADQEVADGSEILRRADIAMYRAKSNGRNQWCMYETAHDVERLRNNSIARDLRDIIRDGSIEVAYQPLIDPQTKLMNGVEALARWPSKMQPYVSPDQFIRVAETSGLIDALGDQILRKVCRDAANWDGMRVAVNISPIQLNNLDFATRVTGILKSEGFDPSRIEFEVTESVLISNFDRAQRIINQLKDCGIQIALDDFGCGFSSIGYLRKLDFDRIKIDRSITSKVTSSSDDLKLVQGVVLLAKSMASEVMAEGIENEMEAKLLHLAGCNGFQGYYFHRPMPAASLTQLHRAERTARRGLGDARIAIIEQRQA